MTMKYGRRRFLRLASAAALYAPVALGQGARTMIDSAGRLVELPATVYRIYAAGPPASILVFAVAPDKLIGWTTAWREAERPFIAQRYADLPTLGRLTGRGNTANVEVVLQAKPDFIIDYVTVSATLASLADRVHAQTGIPYVLLDGDFDRMAEAIREVGRIANEEKRAEALAHYTRETVSDIRQRIAMVPAGRRPRVYYGSELLRNGAQPPALARCSRGPGRPISPCAQCAIRLDRLPALDQPLDRPALASGHPVS